MLKEIKYECGWLTGGGMDNKGFSIIGGGEGGFSDTGKGLALRPRER